MPQTLTQTRPISDLFSFRFYVALTCGAGISQMPPEDVALEICVQFRDRQIQLRACESGVWGEMQPEAPFFPFIRGLPFKVSSHCLHGFSDCTGLYGTGVTISVPTTQPHL